MLDLKEQRAVQHLTEESRNNKPRKKKNSIKKSLKKVGNRIFSTVQTKLTAARTFMATLVHLPHHRSCDPLHLKASMEAMDTQDPCKLEESLSGEGTMIELHTAFDILDRNSDGHVYVEDIHDMMKALGHHDIDKDHVKDFIKNAANGSHSIREDEFISWMQKLDSKQHSDDYIILKGAFETFDKNKDGYISKAELKEGLLLIGEDVSDRTLDLMMQEADKDQDGLINFEDFAQVMA